MSQMLDYTTKLEMEITKNSNKIIKIIQESDLKENEYNTITETIVAVSSSLQKYKKSTSSKMEELKNDYNRLCNELSDYQIDTDTRIAQLKSELEYATTTIIS